MLDANHPAFIKEQALCIVGNIAVGSGNKEYVLDDDNIMAKISEALVRFRVTVDLVFLSLFY